MISPRTAELSLVALAVAWRVARRNGSPKPADWVAAEAELAAASAPTRTTFATTPAPVPPFEQIDVAEAARRLGVTVRAVQKRCAAGTLPAHRVGKRSWVITWQGRE
ncbi:MAG TPA: helix-turn-helix domain-containing protein [Actinoplanes sp.]|nr:helix-turn-helix domain-containing protein [Actinoplanes sp.]